MPSPRGDGGEREDCHQRSACYDSRNDPGVGAAGVHRAVFRHSANIQGARLSDRYTTSTFEDAMNSGCPNSDQPTHSDEAPAGGAG